MTDLKIIFIRLEGLPKTQTGNVNHVHAVAAEKRKWRNAASEAAYRYRMERPFSKASIICVRFSSSEPDDDNLRISFKSVIDGLQDALVIENDSNDVIVHRKYHWEKAPPKNGAIEVTVIGHELMTKEAYAVHRKRMADRDAEKLKRKIANSLAKRPPRRASATSNPRVGRRPK